MRTFDLSRAGVLAVVGLAAGLGSAIPAMAEPRDSVTVTNQNSDVASNSTIIGYGSVPITGTYTARHARIRGTLTKIAAGTFANEALIKFFASAGAPPQAFSTTTVDTFTGSVAVDTFVRFSKPVTPAPGVFRFDLIETFDDAAGPDAVWSTLTVTLNDGAPRFGGLVADFGTINGVTQYSTLTPAGTIRWFKFSIDGAANFQLGTYLDIDTEGSNVSASGTQSNDTEIALYDEEGNVVGADDDDGSYNMSQLSYGAGTRPAFDNSVAYNGRDGTLPAGTYYLRVGGYNANIDPQIGWDYPNTGSPQAGTIHITIRTNLGTPALCPPDFNRDGVLQAQDIFDYLNAWFAGCS